MPTRTPGNGRGQRIGRRAVYDAYLASKSWRDRRKAWYAAWLTRHGTPPACLVCEKTWSPRTGHLHHLTYLRLGGEHNEDLVPLCGMHHRRLHEVWDHSPGWRRLGRAQGSLGMIGMLRRHHTAQPAQGREAS